MTANPASADFKATVLRPAEPGADASWLFLVLPKEASDVLPRRGRATVDGTINGVSFRETLEPDGQLSHWLRIDVRLQEATGIAAGDVVDVEIAPVDEEPDPDLLPDFAKALRARPDAAAVWDGTSTVARIDWIHWITSAKQAKTRAKRIADACEKLASGKRRVCCFDPSGFYSKALRAPRSAD